MASRAPSISRYTVERVLGEGGMGTVHAVLDRSSGVQLALKRLKPGASKAAFALFKREYQVLAGLRHPCIVEVYDYGVDAEGPYYTMELVKGEHLQRRAPVSWREACAYLRDVASILGVLHARQLLHRDLNPRNLIEHRAGRLKLIDFGALASFGMASEVVGTPPFIPPEALRTGNLDQRSDLFSLGTLGYWLVTSQHAFPARLLSDLPSLWEREPRPASELVRELQNPALEVPPPEFDDLLTLLLRTEPSERIANTAELIERLNVVADLAPETEDDVVKGYLHSKAFVGREREQARVRAAIRAARHGHGKVLVIESDSGGGGSRLLQELTLLARLEGAVTLSGDAPSRRAYAVAEALLSRLLRELPGETEARLEPFAADLAPLAPARRALGIVGATQTATSVGEARARLQSALLEVFSGFARSHPIAVFIDGLQDLDEESQAFLAALAHCAQDLKLCLIATSSREASREPSATLASLLSVAERLSLVPLTGQETRDLLRSVFGEVPYLDRLSERLFRASEGNPAHCLELAQHLVATGEARYEDGAWALPMELTSENLPLNRRAGLLLQLARLPSAAHELAQAISVPHGAAWTPAQAAVASESSAEQTQENLQVLVRERVLLSRDDGYVFSHEDVRQKLHDELEPAPRRQIHSRIGRFLRGGADEHDVTTLLSACIHFIRAGELADTYPLLRQALEHCVMNDPALIGRHALAFEQVFCLLRDAQQSQYALCGPLAMLAVAGYFTDRRYAIRYGEASLEALQHVLKFHVFHGLSPFVGRRVALLVTLAVAAMYWLSHRSRCLSIPLCVRLLLFATSTLAGTAAICIDPDRAGRYAKVLEPLTGFGPNHAATVAHDFTALMSLQGRDTPARNVAAMRVMIERLSDPRPIREMDQTLRGSYLAGMHLTMGAFLVRRDDREGLAVADALEQFGPLYAMGADHLRADYYGGQGDVENARKHRKRLEVHAVQLGSAWQVETFAPVDMINIAWRLHDASEMKRAAQELERLSTEAPSLREQAIGARVSYLVLRGKHREAIELSEQLQKRPYQINGWTRMRGTLARAHNALGQHEEARRLCRDALEGADPEDRRYVVMNLGVEIELALAEAGLGFFDRAREQLERLLAMHAPNDGAVTIGSLYEAFAHVALMAGDADAAREHWQRARDRYEPLGVPSLVARTRALGRVIERGERGGGTAFTDGGGHIDGSSLLARLDTLLRDDSAHPGGPRRCLDAIVEVGAADQAVFLPSSADAPITSGAEQSLDSELIEWTRRALEVDADETALTEDLRDWSNERVIGSVHYRTVTLWADAGEPIGVLVLGSNGHGPVSLNSEVLRVITDHLQ